MFIKEKKKRRNNLVLCLPPHSSSLSGSSYCPEVSLPGLGSQLQVTHNCLTFTFLSLDFLVNKIEIIMVPSTGFKGLSSNANKAPRTHAWHIGVALEMAGCSVLVHRLPGWVGKLNEQQTQRCCDQRIGTFSSCSWRFLHCLSTRVSCKRLLRRTDCPALPLSVVWPSSEAHVPILCLPEGPVKAGVELQQLVSWVQTWSCRM